MSAAMLSVLVIFCYAISPTVSTKVGISCIGTSRGTTWYYILSPWALGIIGLLFPTFLMLFLIILLFRKVLIDIYQLNYNLFLHESFEKRIHNNISNPYCFRCWPFVEEKSSEDEAISIR